MTRRGRPLREILRVQRRPSGRGARHRNWLGGWDRCRACVSTGQPAFYSIADTGATFTRAKRALRLTASAHSDTFLRRSLPRSACQTDGLLRNPSTASPAGANPKTGINMPENQKPKSHPACACLPTTKLIDAGFLRKCDTVNRWTASGTVKSFFGVDCASANHQAACSCWRRISSSRYSGARSAPFAHATVRITGC